MFVIYVECAAWTAVQLCERDDLVKGNDFAQNARSLDNVCDMFLFHRLLLAIFINDIDESLF